MKLILIMLLLVSINITTYTQEQTKEALQLIQQAHDLIFETQEERVKRIATDIKKAIGPESYGIPVKITPFTSWNAFASVTYEGTHYIGLNQGLLDDVNDDELALILGHEFSHILLGHVNRGLADLLEDRIHPIFGIMLFEESRHAEKMSDYLGHYIALRAGYSPCSGVTVWKRLMERYGDYMYGNSHPSNSQRLTYFKESCEVL